MNEVMLCGRPGKCCVRAKTLDNGGLELKDEADGREIVLSKDERTELKHYLNGELYNDERK